MSPVFRIVLGIVVALVGFLMAWKTVRILEWFGRNEWAEQTFGSGGSWTFYKLLGVSLVFVGALISTNVVSDILESFAGIFVR